MPIKSDTLLSAGQTRAVVKRATIVSLIVSLVISTEKAVANPQNTSKGGFHV